MTPKIPAKLYQDIYSWICAVPGLKLTGIWLEKDKNRYICEVGIEGWSPTLHPLSMEWMFNTDLSVADISLRDFQENLDGYVTRQKERAERALDYDSPLPLDFDAINHISIDKTLAEIYFIKQYESFRRKPSFQKIKQNLKKILKNTHVLSINNNRDVIFYEDEDLEKNITTSIFETDDDMVMDLSIDLDLSDNVSCIFTGNEITIKNKNIPESLIESLSGKRLIDLLEIDGRYSKDRIIKTVINSGDDINVSLVPSYIKIGDYEKELS